MCSEPRFWRHDLNVCQAVLRWVAEFSKPLIGVLTVGGAVSPVRLAVESSQDHFVLTFGFRFFVA
jgi:hypothetical protein